MIAEDSATPDDGTLDETVLETLVQFDEALRRGRIPTNPAEGLSDEQLSDISRAARGLVELEGAFPRHLSQAAAVVRLPSHVGRFVIEGVLGSGGFAVVYKARDEMLHRTVALKIPRPHALAPDLRRRFVREAQAAAQLDHPHIVPIYEAGEAGELPYIAYAYCDGPTLAAWVKALGTPPPQLAARLMIQLAEAVQFSHARGILHRDIKPSNVLLFPQDVPGDKEFPFTPRLSDLGLAKLIESSLEETLTDMVIGTPLYMSPEQAAGRNADIAAACDIYSLGATFYYLLTGRPPFLAPGLIQALNEVIERDPIAPMELNPAVDRDLNTICLKCLEKSPGRRYLSAQALADDLRRYLAGEPILARPASMSSRVWRWCRRRPAIAGLLVGVAAMGVALIGSLAWNSYTSTRLQGQLTRQNKQLSFTVGQLDESLRTARQLLYVADLQLAAAAWQRRDTRSAAALLRRLELPEERETPLEFGWHYLRALVSPPSQLLAETGQTIWCAGVSPDGKWLAVGGNKGLVQLFATTINFAPARTLLTEQSEVNQIACSPDSLQLATAGDDGTVRIWDVRSGELTRTLPVSPGKPVFGVNYFDQGRRLAAGGKSGAVTLWDCTTGTVVETLDMPSSVIVECLAAAPDGARLAAGGSDGSVVVWWMDRRQQDFVRASHRGAVAAIQFTPDGRQLITGGADGTVQLHDLAAGESRRILARPEGISGLAVSPSAEILCGDRGGAVTLLAPSSPTSPIPEDPAKAASWQVLKGWSASDARLPGVAFAQGGDSVITGDAAGQLRLWPQDRAQRDRILPPTMSAPPMGNSVLPGTEPDVLYRAGPWGLEVWDVRHGRIVETLFSNRSLCICRLTPNGKTWLLGDDRGQVGMAHRDQPQDVQWRQVFTGAGVRELACCDQGKRLVALAQNNQLVVTDPAFERDEGQWSGVSTFSVAPEGNWLVIARHESNDLSVLAADTLKVVAVRPAHKSTIQRIVFSRDGRRMLTASDDRTVTVWNTQNWSALYSLLGHDEKVHGLAVSPDRRTIATGDISGRIRLWHLASGQELFELAQLRDPPLSLDFSIDGERLYALDDKLAVHVFTAPRPRRPH